MISISLIATALLAAGQLTSGEQPRHAPRTPSTPPDARGIGMIGDGWDGPGQNSTVLYFRVENAVSNRGPAQREQLLEVLADWAGVVQIHFVESAIPNRSRSIDLLWAAGEHCALEHDECGFASCAFVDQPDFQSLAHAAYPPGIGQECGGVSQESRSGNVHLNLNAPIQTNPDNAGYSYRLVVAKMIGHALGLQPNPNPGDHNVMGPIEWNENYLGISADDAAQIQQGYAAGVGSVTTLESLGVWVNSNWTGQELGTPGSPFDTLAEGIAGVPPFGDQVVVHVQAGLYPETLTIATPCIITSEFGAAYIGQ